MPFRGGEAKGLPLEFAAANPPRGEFNPSLEGLGPLLTEDTSLAGGETNPKLVGLAFLKATGDDLASNLALRQVTEVSLSSALAVGVGL